MTSLKENILDDLKWFWIYSFKILFSDVFTLYVVTWIINISSDYFLSKRYLKSNTQDTLVKREIGTVSEPTTISLLFPRHHFRKGVLVSDIQQQRFYLKLISLKGLIVRALMSFQLNGYFRFDMLSQCHVPYIAKKVNSYSLVVRHQPLQFSKSEIFIKVFSFILKSIKTFLIQNYFYSNDK